MRLRSALYPLASAVSECQGNGTSRVGVSIIQLVNKERQVHSTTPGGTPAQLRAKLTRDFSGKEEVSLVGKRIKGPEK